MTPTQAHAMNERHDVVAQQVADALAPEATYERYPVRAWRFRGYSVPLCAKLGEIVGRYRENRAAQTENV